MYIVTLFYFRSIIYLAFYFVEFEFFAISLPLDFLGLVVRFLFFVTPLIKKFVIFLCNLFVSFCFALVIWIPSLQNMIRLPIKQIYPIGFQEEVLNSFRINDPVAMIYLTLNVTMLTLYMYLYIILQVRIVYYWAVL